MRDQDVDMTPRNTSLRTRSLLSAVLVISMFVSVAGKSANCQVLYGSIVGAVTDQTGAVVAGASVSATHVGTNTNANTVTGKDGIYSLLNLPAGVYTVTISAQGFRELITKNVQVAFNATARVDGRLQVSAASQSVTVSASSAVLQTDTSDVHADITSPELLNLPQPTRSYQGLIGTLPGAGLMTAANGGTNNPTLALKNVEINGTSARDTNINIEGITAVDAWSATDSTAMPSVEAVQTVNVVSGSPNAEQGLAGGATVSVQLKSGSNDLHAEAYWNHTDNALTAKPYFSGSNFVAPKNIYNDIGGTVGGPIIKNRLFYFVSYEASFRRQNQPQIGTVPLTSVLAGNFEPLLAASGNPDPTNPTLCNPTAGTAAPCIFDPATGNPDGTGRSPFFATASGSTSNPACHSGTCYNMIPLSRLSPITAKLDAMVPAPNFGGASAIANNYNGTVALGYNLQLIDTKVDWDAIPNKFRVSFRGGIDPFKGTGVPLFGPKLGSSWNAGNVTPDAHGLVASFTGSFTYTVSPTFIIDGGVGVTHTNEITIPTGGSQKYTSDVLGIPGTNLGKLPFAGGLADFAMGCSIFSDAGGCSSTYTGYGENFNYLQYLDPVFGYFLNFTKVIGRHTVKFGTNIINTHLNHFETGPDVISFDGGVTTDADRNQPYKITNGIGNLYNSYADFMIGAPTSWYTSALLPGGGMTRLRSWSDSIYVGDTWQVTRNLTLSYGSGWEYFPVPTHKDHGLEIFLPGPNGTGTYEVCGYGAVPQDCGIQVSKLGFTPRAGIAYRPMKDLAVRLGYGLSRQQYNMARDAIYNEPETLTYSDTALNKSPYFPVGSLSVGIPTPTVPNYQSGIISPLPAGFTLKATDPINFKRGYVQSYNATVQKTLGPWSAQAAYVGTHTIHMYTSYNFNYCSVGSTGKCNQYYPVFGAQPETMLLPLNNARYNAFQTQLTRQFRNGYYLAANYTYSKWIGMCCTSDESGGPKISDPAYFSLNDAIRPGNLPHVFNLTGIAQSPFGKRYLRNGGVGSLLLGGWQLNGVLTARSGLPFSINAGNIAAGSSQLATYANGASAGHVSYPHKLNKWFDPTDFTAKPSCPSGVSTCFGNVAFDSLVGPRAINLDASLFRDFKIMERLTAEFRAEAFNVTNTPHFSNPNSSISSGAFGQISSVNAVGRLIDQRYLRFGLKLLF